MDKEIIQLIRNKDEAGLDMLQSKYCNMLHYVIKNILPDERDADECISDIILQIWRKFDLFDETKGSLSTWMTAIARNTAINRIKKQGAPLSELKEDSCSVPSPEESYLKNEGQLQLVQAINKLSLLEKKIFYRKYYYLQTTALIASELGLSERSVEGKIYRMKKKIGRWLGVLDHEK